MCVCVLDVNLIYHNVSVWYDLIWFYLILCLSYHLILSYDHLILSYPVKSSVLNQMLKDDAFGVPPPGGSVAGAKIHEAQHLEWLRYPYRMIPATCSFAVISLTFCSAVVEILSYDWHHYAISCLMANFFGQEVIGGRTKYRARLPCGAWVIRPPWAS